MNRNDIVAEARSWLGTPYHHQGSVKGAGCDCLGLVRGVYRALYGPEPGKVPPYARENEGGEGERLVAGMSRYLSRVDPPGLPGDVLVFRLRPGTPARHCGILIAPSRFIHAVSGRSVAEASLSPWWSRRLVACFLFPDLKD